jgi:hypothetical protein
MIRYARTFGNDSFAVAAENPEADFTGNNTANTYVPTTFGSLPSINLDQIPDFTGIYTHQFPWGALSAEGMVRKIRAKTSSVKDSVWGYEVGMSGRVNLLAKDNVKFEFLAGRGNARYFAESPGQSASFNGASLKTQGAWGGYIGYQHWWTDAWRSNLILGYQGFNNNVEVVGSTQNKHFETAHINLIGTVLPSLDLGVEFIHASRTLDNGTKGRVDRILTSAKYAF